MTGIDMKDIEKKEDIFNQVHEMMPLSTEEQNDIFDERELDEEI